MTAHVKYDAWDPNECATLSGTVIQRVIRERIGFDGLLLTDDLDMRALSGTVASLAVRSLAAGCDVALNCWGDMAVMRALADALPEVSDDCRRRVASVAQQFRKPRPDQELIERQRYCIEARDRLLVD
jgi:beta-N-acetylhexosaminidase